MNTKIKLFIITAFALAIFSSCYEGIIIEGNNEIAEETRSLPVFNEVISSGSFHVYYAHGDSTGVRIECESNLLMYIETYVDKSRLQIRCANHVNIHNNSDIEVYVTSPAIKKIHLSGSGKIEADSVSGNSLEIEVSGSGDIQSHFYGKDLNSTISGSGVMDIFADCETVETEVSGSGRINIEAENCLNTIVSISGSGKAELDGSSDKATFKIVGSGKISAFECPVNEAIVRVSGSGNVYVNVSNLLDVILSGSGNLHYKGSPVIKSTTSGSGVLFNDN